MQPRSRYGLGSLQTEVLESIWEAGEATVADVELSIFSDDRFVDSASGDSNERLVSERLLRGRAVVLFAASQQFQFAHGYRQIEGVLSIVNPLLSFDQWKKVKELWKTVREGWGPGQ